MISDMTWLFPSFWNKTLEEYNSTESTPKLEEFVETTPDETKNYTGKITSLNHGEGVIGCDIYFTLESNNLNKYKIGDNVKGKAVRKSKESAWRAVDITLNDEILWGEEYDEICEEKKACMDDIPPVFVSKVQSIHNQMVTLINLISFIINDENCNFDIVAGDWVECECGEKAEIRSQNVISMSKVYPVRRKTVHGYITQLQPNYFVINAEIFCLRRHIRLRVRLRDKVVAEVIESDQREFAWRAVRVSIDKNVASNIQLQTSIFSPAKDNKNKPGEDQTLLTTSLNQPKDEPIPGLFLDSGITVNLKSLGCCKYISIAMKNGSHNIFSLENIFTLSSSSSKPQISVDKTLKFPIAVLPKSKIVFVFSCIGYDIGESLEIIRFQISPNKFISSKVFIRVQKPISEPQLFTNNYNVNKNYKGRIVQGEKPFNASPFLSIKLPLAEVPKYLWDAVQTTTSNILSVCPSLEMDLAKSNYTEKFSLLLHLEEIAMNSQMRKYDIPLISFSQHGQYLSLVVEGLSENRPSLIVGDSVIASVPYKCDDQLSYEGIVHEVLANKVLLKFNPNFHSSYGGEDYAVSFHFNRTPLRRCHSAVSMIIKQLGADILFPRKLNLQLPQVAYIENGLDSENGNNNNNVSVKSNYPEMRVTSSFNKNSNRKSVSGRNWFGDKDNKQEETIIKRFRYSLTFTDRSGYCVPVISSKNPKIKLECKIPRLVWFNKDLNEEQKIAVKMILDGCSRPIPYIIYGPPGTGKTVTLVEAILQVSKLVPHSRILAVGPTNNSCDLIALRAIQKGNLKQGHIVRINAFNRNIKNIPEELAPYSVSCADLSNVVHHRILVCTAVTSGMLYSANLSNGHFSHLFVDEAGQLTEPETCISLGLVNNCTGQIVLAGDPKQLGPMVVSPIAKRYGLGNSYLHRLCSSVLYQPDDERLKSIYNSKGNEMSLIGTSVNDILNCDNRKKLSFEPRLVTLLVKNYRSHNRLLQVPSTLFYHGTLECCAGKSITERLCAWDQLPTKGVPLLFHPVIGENCQENDSPSWFNPEEAFQICRYLLSLLNFGVNSDDIGIITPYRKQVEKIRELMLAFGIENRIRVGTVEDFQGDEKLVVLISTVRSSGGMIPNDVTHNIGFLSSDQRFNVAITRARSLLIVVGNAQLLSQDPNWNYFIQFCVSNNAVKI